MNCKNKKIYKNILFIFFISVILIITILGFHINGFASSDTNSLPYSLFLKIKNNKNINKGEIVTFYMPKIVIRKMQKYYFPEYWYKPFDQFTKIVGCSGGDILNTVKNSDFCNGKKIATVLEGMKFKKWHNYKIPKNKFFALGTNKDSLDSRYLGLIKYSAIRNELIPLLPYNF